MNLNPLVDVEVAAVHAGVTIHAVYRWVRDGHLKTESRRPLRVRLDAVSEVRDMMRARHSASLLRGTPVRK